MAEVPFHLTRINGCHVKAQNERFTAVGSYCWQNIKIGMFLGLHCIN